MFQVGYASSLGYVVAIWFLTGFLILLFDRKELRKKKLKKEERVAAVLGWLNVSLGILLWIGNWALQRLG
ncbi:MULTISPECIES: CLC_0170 family protein [Cohnella]|jgi:hypothetical protein|uniref:CLC_0170 family protein n=1 Tax=Cohnella TaxID=329857 RepID=UPI0003652641|nr:MULTISPECIES: CLC_0170 family protein [Cohnella]REK65347.1 MAG: hypothetical protein C6P35_10620 [Cohnella sp.]